MNTDTVTKHLETSKAFVGANASDVSEDTALEIQSLLSGAIECAKADDEAGLIDLLEEIDSHTPNGWDLTSNVKSELADS